MYRWPNSEPSECHSKLVVLTSTPDCLLTALCLLQAFCLFLIQPGSLAEATQADLLAFEGPAGSPMFLLYEFYILPIYESTASFPASSRWKNNNLKVAYRLLKDLAYSDPLSSLTVSKKQDLLEKHLWPRNFEVSEREKFHIIQKKTMNHTKCSS